MYPSYRSPGVFIESSIPGKTLHLETGVPVFLGLVRKKDIEKKGYASVATETPGVSIVLASGISVTGSTITAVSSESDGFFPLFSSFSSACEALGDFMEAGFLGIAVSGFFENGGGKCHIHPVCYDETICSVHAAVEEALETLENLTGADLILMPDLMWLLGAEESVDVEDVVLIQNSILAHTEKVTGRFAVIDGLPGADLKDVSAQRKKLKGNSGALYYPWIKPTTGGKGPFHGFAPPSGHVCGVYARSDRQRGIHKAPANEEIYSIADVMAYVGNSEQDFLNPMQINAIRAFPGRGIRLWGARTLSRRSEWVYVNVRRFYLSLAFWLEREMASVVFEPDTPELWSRIVRKITEYLNRAFLEGALKGSSPSEGFYVICDSRTNTHDIRERGCVVAEIGIAPSEPLEFIVFRITSSDGGTRISEENEVETVAEISGPVFTEHVIRQDVRVTYIAYKGKKSSEVTDEYVLIENRGLVDADIGNWSLRDSAGHVYVFPNTVLTPGGSCRVWTGNGIDTGENLYWRLKRAVWNDTGDQAELRDKDGRTVSVYSYTG